MSKLDQIKALGDAKRAARNSSRGGVKESPVSIPDYNGVKSPALVTAHGLSGKSCPLRQSETAPREAKRGRGRPKIAGPRPWDAAGISRTTYYRERRRAEQKEIKK